MDDTERLPEDGRPLERSLRERLEAAFGRALDHVRIHTGPSARVSARARGAAAYAEGSHIFFDEGRYQPASASGLWLLAHELTHVVQHSSGGLQSPDEPEVLEQIADAAAGIIAAGGVLPPDFAFGAARPGQILLHQDTPCAGVKISAGDKSVWLPANSAIEQAYKLAHPANDQIFFGSEFETGRDVVLPKGVKNRKFGNALLTKLRGLSQQRRPDIIDFANRVFYEIKTAGQANEGVVQVDSYYKITESIIQAHGEDYKSKDNRDGEPSWKKDYATWYPAHVLPLPGDTTGTKFVCTQATDHTKYGGGLLLYDVREVAKGAPVRVPVKVRVPAYDTSLSRVARQILRKAGEEIKTFNPSYPDYVVVYNQAFYDMNLVKVELAKNAARNQAHLRVPTPLVFNSLPLPQLIGDALIILDLDATDVLLIVAGAALVVCVVVAAAPLVAGGAAAATSAPVVVGTGAEITAAGGAVTTGAGAGAGAGVVSGTLGAGNLLTAVQAFLAGGGIKTAATVGAGVAAVVLVDTKTAQAATAAAGPSAATPPAVPKFDVERTSVVKFVPVNDFSSVGDVPAAYSNKKDLGRESYSAEGLEQRFTIGKPVLFDDEQHWILARLTVE